MYSSLLKSFWTERSTFVPVCLYVLFEVTPGERLEWPPVGQAVVVRVEDGGVDHQSVDQPQGPEVVLQAVANFYTISTLYLTKYLLQDQAKFLDKDQDQTYQTILMIRSPISYQTYQTLQNIISYISQGSKF